MSKSKHNLQQQADQPSARKHNIKTLLKAGAFLALSLILFITYSLYTRASIPDFVNYQGRLRDTGGNPITVATTIQFSLYSHITNGAPTDAPGALGPLLWTETYDGSAGCAQITPGTDGIFAQHLGDCVPFPAYLDFTGEYYLGVKIGADAEASPRVPLSTHPYAFTSKRVHVETGDLVINSADATGDIIMNTAGGMQINSSNALFPGAVYQADYSANYTNRSIVDKEYVDQQLMWEIVNGGERIQPKNNSVKQIFVREDSNSYTQFRVENHNDTGNGAGAIIELKGSGADYTNNMYIGKYGANFWIPELQDNGAVLTDKNLVIGTASDAHEIHFVTGHSYSNLAPVVVADDEGFRYTSDLSATFVDRTLVDKEYVDGLVSGSAITASNGLIKTGNNIQLGGLLTADTFVNKSGHSMRFNGDGFFQTQVFLAGQPYYTNAQQNIDSLNFVLQRNSDGLQNSLQISPTAMVFRDQLNNRGVEYLADYSANYTNRTLVDKEYVDNQISNSTLWEKGTGVNSARLISQPANDPSGNNAIAVGDSNTASGNNSQAFGILTQATGEATHTEGYRNIASDFGAHAEGGFRELIGHTIFHRYNQATGLASHAEGYDNIAGGKGSHVEGYNNNDQGHEQAHIEGNHNNAYASRVHIEGFDNEARADDVHIEGSGHVAYGQGSHIEGRYNVTNGIASHAEGSGTIAQNVSSHAAGRYNVGTSNETIHETGIGTDDAFRANAFEIYTDGSILAPEFSIAEINARGARSLTTKEYVDGAILAGANNIYTTDGVLTGDRVLDANGNSLNFHNNWIDYEINDDASAIIADDVNSRSRFDIEPFFFQMYSQNNNTFVGSSINGNDNGILLLKGNTVGGVGNETSLTFRTGLLEIATDNTTFQGATYDKDYSANYTNRTLVDKEYVDGTVASATPWTRDTVNGYIYQKVLSDNIGIGTNIPDEMLTIYDGNIKISQDSIDPQLILYGRDQGFNWVIGQDEADNVVTGAFYIGQGGSVDNTNALLRLVDTGHLYLDNTNQLHHGGHLSIMSEGTNTRDSMIFVGMASDTSFPEINLYRAKNSAAIEGQLINNDIIGRVGFIGNGNTTSYTPLTFMQGVATETWTNTTRGAELNFFTAPNGTINSIKRLVVENDGTLNVGDTVDYENLVLDDDDIPNKAYVDNSIVTGNTNIYNTNGTIASNRTVNVNNANLDFLGTDGRFMKTSTDSATGHWAGHLIEYNLLDFELVGANTFTDVHFTPGEIKLETNNPAGDYIVTMGSQFLVDDQINSRGIDYAADYSANYTNRTLVDKEYVDNADLFELGGNTTSLISKINNASGGSSVGVYSFSVGRDVDINGSYGAGFGYGNDVGHGGFVYGGYFDNEGSIVSRPNTASGDDSFAGGISNIASGGYSLSIGANNTSSGGRSVSFGGSNVSDGTDSFAIGYNNTVRSNRGFVSGTLNTINTSNDSAILVGSNNTISGNSSVIIGGADNTLNHIGSVIIGMSSKTSDANNTTYTQTLSTRGIRKEVSTKTNDYIMTKEDHLIRIDATSNSVMVSLPQIDNSNHGQEYVFKVKNITNSAQINTTGTSTFNDGSSNFIFTSVGQVLHLVADNNNNEWVKIEDSSNLGSMFDLDHDTGIQVEEAADEDMIRFDIAGNQVLRINDDSLLTYGTEITDYNVAVFGTVHSRNLVKQEDGDMAGYAVSTWGDNTSPARFVSVKARGDEGSETALQDGDEITELASIGYDGTQYMTTGGIIVAVDGSVAVNDLPSKIKFMTNSGGGNLGSDEKMTLDKDGNLGIGVTTPAYKVDISGGALMLDGIAAAPTASQGYAGIYTNNGELFAFDENANSTQISPHNKDGLWWYNSTNTKTGKTIQIEMELLTKELNKMLGGGYITENGEEIDKGENVIHRLSLQTTANISTLEELQTSVDNNLTIINQSLVDLDKKVKENKEDIKTNTETLATLSENINSLTELTTNLTDTVEDHETRIAQLETILAEDGINLSAQGGPDSVWQSFSDNLTVLKEEGKDIQFTLDGDLVVKKLKAEKIDTKEITLDKKSVGLAIIKAGDKEVVVETNIIDKNSSRIILTPHDTVVVAIKKVKDGKSFTIKIAEEQEDDLEVEWLIIQQNK